MSFCSDPDKPIKKKIDHKRKTSYGTGKNAGHRHRGQPILEVKEQDWGIDYSKGIIALPNGTPIEAGNKSDEMWDTHGFIQNWYNPCVREKYYAGGSNQLDNISDEDGVILNFRFCYPSSRNALRSTVPFLTEAYLDELALRSVDKLSKVVTMNMSLVNFIIELIEVLEGNIKILKRFQKLYDKAIFLYKRELARLRKQGVKDQAARWLAWNFAIKPTLSDLKGLVCSSYLANKKMAWLRDHNHKLVELEYGVDVSDHVNFDPFEWVGGDARFTITHAHPPSSPANGPWHTEVQWREISLKYNAKSRIFLDIPDIYLDGALGMGVLWSVMQGISNPVGIIWEAIPFSWLIDYFLSYRARLFQDMFDINPYNNGVTVMGYGHSFTLKATAEIRTINSESGWVIGGGPVQYELYSRRDGLPFPEQTTLFRNPWSWYHASLVGAIIIGFVNPRAGGRRR
jgi:hypothetical protein